MERTLTPEEKIKRAEEIYARRRSGYTRNKVATVNVSKEKNYDILKKIILQILICLLIYFIFYLIQNSNYVFSEDVINKTKEILSYDIDLQGMYTQFVNGFNNWSAGIVDTSEQTNTIDTNVINQNVIQDSNVINTQNTLSQNAIGGAELQNVVMEDIQVSADENNEKPEEPLTDDEYIKSNFSFIKPVEGIVSSEFGLRDVANPVVSKNHTGIDIAANTGTKIVAAMEGTVTVSSTTGDYGYHIKITNGDVSTLYAHCSKLYVKEGDVVTQGQEIAEVGSTGKSTGPHLHFEIMRGQTYINPRNILEF